MQWRTARYLRHGPRRLVTRPWRRICRCGYGAWPCHPLTMLRLQAQWAPERDVRPSGNATTNRLPVAPLSARGQAVRNQPKDRW